MCDAAEGAAREVKARPKDGRFLEATLEAAIARRPPGVAATDQQRRRMALDGFDPQPYGVDVDWTCGESRVGIEVKVTDVIDSLFDIVKLAATVAQGLYAQAFCAVAATGPQWSGCRAVD